MSMLLLSSGWLDAAVLGGGKGTLVLAFGVVLTEGVPSTEMIPPSFVAFSFFFSAKCYE